MNEFLNSFFGWPTFILALIPLVICVRIFVRTSRWSILKVLAIAVSGTLISSAWLFYASLLTNNNLGGDWGRAVGQCLAGWVGDSAAFYLLSVGLFAWVILANLDFIVSGARYFINKPYIKEIIVEVEKEVPIAPKEKPKQTKAKPIKKVDPTPEDDGNVVKEYDDLASFKSLNPAILSSRAGEIRKVSP